MVDERTHRFYEANAESVAERHHSLESPVERYFASAFPPGSRVLNLGTGSGRDLALLLARGHDALGLEPSAELRRCALERHPELEGRLFAGALPADLSELTPLGGLFDGLLCCAVLQHLPPEDLPAAARTLGSLLRPGGHLLASLPVGRKVGADHRAADDRLFSGLSAETLARHLEPEGLIERERHVAPDALGREGTTWVTLLFQREPKGAER